jgi:hypothetical protein
VYVGSLDDGEHRHILHDTDAASFSPLAPGRDVGHLLFVREATLMAPPFDARTGQLSARLPDSESR